MTPNIQAFVRDLVRQRAINATGAILEIGSFDVNGGVRQYFPDAAEYIGLDMREGPGVDMVADAHYTNLETNRFDVVLCLDMLEHDPAPWLTATEILRLLKPGGVAIVTVPGFGFPRHDYPSDYWRFSVEAVQQLFWTMDVHANGYGDHVFAILRHKHGVEEDDIT